MKKLEIYSAYEGREDVEGRCTWKLIANFTNPEDAEKAAKGKYSGYGPRRDGKVEPTNIDVFESYSEYDAASKKKLREEAMGKLSQEELDALGLER